MSETTPDTISDLVANLPRFLGAQLANSFVALDVTHGEIATVIHSDLLELLTDPTLSLRFIRSMNRHLTGKKLVFLSVTDLSEEGSLAIDKMRLLTLKFNLTDTAVVRTSEYARDGGRGLRLPLVLSPPLEPIRPGISTVTNGIHVTRGHQGA